MTPRNTSDLAPLSSGRRVGFLVVTGVAFVLDLVTVVPDHADPLRDRRWTVYGSWETTTTQFVPVLLAVYAVLLLRRSSPLGTLVWAGVVSLAFTLGATPALPVVGLLVCLYTAASLLTHPAQVWLALAFAVAVQWAGLLLLPAQTGRDLGIGALLLAGISSALWLFGRRDHDARLAAAGLPDRLAEHGEAAASQERQRIARELHDILAHSVSAMMMQAAGGKAMTTALRQDMADDLRLESVERALATIENTGSESMRELHRLLSVLRGEDGEQDGEVQASAQPGMADLPRLLDLTRQSGLVVELHTAGCPVRLDPSVGLAAYRVVQESLTNAMKHGGRGAVVDVFQSWRPDCLQLQVRCRSGHHGLEAPGLVGGNGLYGLRERVELIGGTFESGRVGEEFVVTASLPLTVVTAEPGPGAEVTRGPNLLRPGRGAVGPRGEGMDVRGRL